MNSLSRPSIFVVVPLPPSYRGGTEEYAYRLAKRFAETVPVFVSTTTVRWDPGAEFLSTGNATLDRVNAFEMFQRPVVLSPWARRRIERDVRRANVVQLHMPFPGIERRLVHRARKWGVPSVLTYHMDAALTEGRSDPAARIVTSMYRQWSAHPALRSCDAIVANSRGFAEASPVLSRYLPKVRVIHKGVDPERLGLPALRSGRERPTCVPADLTPSGRRVLLFVGRLVPYKGVSILIDALASLLNRGRDLVLLIAGRGPLEALLREQAGRVAPMGRIGFLGFVPDGQLGPLYRFADAMVAPSLNPMEATSTALEEAVACGTPVVGTALPGTGETIPNEGHRGLLVPPGDAGLLAEAIDRILSEERPPPPEKIRTWNDVAEEYWNLFLELGVRLPTFDSGPMRAPLMEKT